ncbi:Glyco_hydro_32N domain-containing protein [Meloidogyne graminicola]|uniref:beta-fructofuranosidase n=1 Tax=Meloidogyne graminicola TaxID=189291 RepID=A0A8S9ZVS2_9BILA|nr:Glyco_hydro_32N domain-containing protein [Meloidogyne graminicola]
MVFKYNSSSSSSSSSSMKQLLPLILYKTSIIHIWFKIKEENQLNLANIKLKNEQGINITLAETNQFKEFIFFEMLPKIEGNAFLEWSDEDTWVSYIYVYEPESVLELGIRPLFVANAARNPEIPENYHFRPPLGWMNDPNGFSKFGQSFHLFYQHYPHSLKWQPMHWGHAVSHDLVNWIHLPLFLLPDPKISFDKKQTGGIFSGSAIPFSNSLKVFYTDSFLGRNPMEYQRMVSTINGINPSGLSKTIIPEGPQNLNLTQDFRDPNVILGPDGKWKMILGSRDNQGGVILLYGTDNPTAENGWNFLNILYRDNRLGMTVAECSGLVPIDGNPQDPNTLWALIYAQLNSNDTATGRRDLTTVLVGNFDGINFNPLFEQEMDFGTHAYAFQALYNSELGTLVIAWLANWKDWNWATKPDFPTAMILPRKLTLSSDKKSLLTPPIDWVINKLINQNLDQNKQLEKGQFINLPNGTAQILFSLNKNQLNIQEPISNDQRSSSNGNKENSTFIRLEIEHPKLKPVGVEISPEGIEILNGPPKQPQQRLIALGAKPREVQVIVIFKRKLK